MSERSQDAAKAREVTKITVTKPVKDEKCKHGCGRYNPVGRYECYACRSKLARQKLKEGPSEADLLRVEVERLNGVALERDAAFATLEERLKASVENVKKLQEKHDSLVLALLDKDVLRVERDAIDRNYKELLEKFLLLESSVQKSRRSSVSVDLSASTSSLAGLVLSPSTKRKSKAQPCKKCGNLIYKRGARKADVEYCVCVASDNDE